MLAVAKTRPGPGIELIECPEPKISSANEVLVEVVACGICGSDLHTYRWETGISIAIDIPRVLGHEGVGIVREVGKNVVDLKAGDRVALDQLGGCGFCYYCRLGLFNLCDYTLKNRFGRQIDGGFARYVVAPFFRFIKIPDSISYEAAAVLEPLGVALRSFERCHLKPGDHAVILGPGPIGLFAAMLARLSGVVAPVVAGLDIDRERLQLAAQFGAETVDVTAQNLQEKVLELTEGRGADVVFDFAGGSKTFSESIKLARKGGEVVLAGIGIRGDFNQTDIVLKELAVMGALATLPSTWQRAIDLVASGTLDPTPVITHVFPLEKAEEAFQMAADGKGAKIILKP